MFKIVTDVTLSPLDFRFLLSLEEYLLTYVFEGFQLYNSVWYLCIYTDLSIFFSFFDQNILV